MSAIDFQWPARAFPFFLPHPNRHITIIRVRPRTVLGRLRQKASTSLRVDLFLSGVRRYLLQPAETSKYPPGSVNDMVNTVPVVWWFSFEARWWRRGGRVWGVEIVQRSWPYKPVLHGQPFAPLRVGIRDLFLGGVLQRAEKGNTLPLSFIVVTFDVKPACALCCEEIVAALDLV